MRDVKKYEVFHLADKRARTYRPRGRVLKPLSGAVTLRAAAARLREYFRRNGYVRMPNEERRREGQHYRKGYEVRLIAFDSAELREMQRLLRRLSFVPARPFRKHSQTVQTIHGERAVKWFRPSLRTRP